MAEVRILMVDDHAMFRDGLRAVLEHQDDMVLVGEAGDARTAIFLAEQLQPDVVLMDLNLPHEDSMEVIRRIRAGQAGVKVIALTMYRDDVIIAAAVQAGVHGYMLKDARASELLGAIRTVAAGGAAVDPGVAARVLEQYRDLSARDEPSFESGLTGRELDILQQVGAGRSNREIATALALSEQTIKNTLSGVYQKLGVSNRAEAAMVALKRRLIKPAR